MRDVRRIATISALIQRIWMTQIDSRYNQLIHNLQEEYNAEKNGVYSKELYEKEVYEKFDIVSYRKASEVDLFNVEDEDFIEFLQKKLDEYNK